MALLQEIKVPLLAVNDTTLTVVEINFESGTKVQEGDQLMVFETSKTTYEVVAEATGYIQYYCEIDNDYAVNEVVAKIVDSPAELETIKPAAPIVQVTGNGIFHQPAAAENNWEGEPVFSESAASLVASSGIDVSGFKGRDFVSRTDVEDLLGISNQQKPLKAVAPSQPVNKIKTVAPTGNEKLILEKLSSVIISESINC